MLGGCGVGFNDTLKETFLAVSRFLVDEVEFENLKHQISIEDEKAIRRIRDKLTDLLLKRDLLMEEVERSVDEAIEVLSRYVNIPCNVTDFFSKVKHLVNLVRAVNSKHVIVSHDDFAKLKASITDFLYFLSLKSKVYKGKIREILDNILMDDSVIFLGETWKMVEEVFILNETEFEKEKKVLVESLKVIIKELTEAASRFSDLEAGSISRLGFHLEKLEEFIYGGNEGNNSVEQVLNVVKGFVSSVKTEINKLVDELRTAKNQLNTAYKLIEKMKVEVERQREMTLIDELTGVYNRRGFLEFFNREVEKVKRYGGTFSVALIDLDNFKGVNEEFGHVVGDKVLVYVVKMMKELVRSSDILGRYGGDEFMLLMCNSGEAEARAVLERIRGSVESKVFRYRNREIKVTLSICFTLVNSPVDFEVVVDGLSKKLKEAKLAGKNMVVKL